MLDLDGVLVDFLAGAHKFHGIPYSNEDYPYEYGSYENCPPPNSDMNTREFWDALDAEFWTGLSWTSDGREILAAVEQAFGKENICLLTSPTLNHECIIGKMKWIERELSEYRRRYLIGPAKAFCAAPDTVLVDDANINVEDFAEAGGYTILVPRPWNLLHAADTMSSFRTQLQTVQAGYHRSQR